MKLSEAEVQQFRDKGYVVARGVFDAATVAGMIEHYMAMRAKGPMPGDMGGDPTRENDPLNRYPRMINMHGWDDQTELWARDAGLLAVLEQVLDDAPVLNQTMLYFKPPGARGQAHHQDQQYITIEPLVGAWVALDGADEANGQMTLIPGSNQLGLLPVEEADITTSFTGGQTVWPEGMQEVGIDMRPGDVLLFAGKTIHGSHPNRTADRWRRSFICHYVGAHAHAFKPAPGTHMTDLAKKAA